MYTINEHQLAINIAEQEGLKDSVNIGQIKEVLNITLNLLREEIEKGNEEGVLELINRQK